MENKEIGMAGLLCLLSNKNIDDMTWFGLNLLAHRMSDEYNLSLDVEHYETVMEGINLSVAIEGGYTEDVCLRLLEKSMNLIRGE